MPYTPLGLEEHSTQYSLAGGGDSAREARLWKLAAGVSAGVAVVFGCALALTAGVGAAPAALLAAEQQPLGGANRKTYAPARISVDPHTPKAARELMKHKGMSLIFSDEFKSLKHTKDHFVFEDIPYGVPGNTGDINIVSSYTSDMVELLPGGGMRLKCELTDKSHKEFMAGWNGTTNTNYDTLPELWEWKAPKVTSRLNGRFQYGYVEVRLKAPKGYGPWPAAWLNGCYGFVAESTGEFLLQDDYPFLCGQFWPPELDFFEHFSPEHTWWWRPNSQSVHSPNQCAAAAGPPPSAFGRAAPLPLLTRAAAPTTGTWASGATRRRRAGTARRRSPARARRGASG